eukprot:scaffold30221_cov62-Isochrysis_galbana.AAC.1
MRVHVPGVGDFSLAEVRAIEDPCPLPDKTVRRRLDARDKRLYAPMSNLGDLVYDADAVYVDIPDSAVRFSQRKKEHQEEEEEDEGVGMVRQLQAMREEASLNAQMQDAQLQLFAGGAALAAQGGQGDSDGESEGKSDGESDGEGESEGEGEESEGEESEGESGGEAGGAGGGVH